MYFKKNNKIIIKHDKWAKTYQKFYINVTIINEKNETGKSNPMVLKKRKQVSPKNKKIKKKTREGEWTTLTN